LTPERTRDATLFERLTVARLSWSGLVRLNGWLELVGKAATGAWVGVLGATVVGLDWREPLEDAVNAGRPVRSAVVVARAQRYEPGLPGASAEAMPSVAMTAGTGALAIRALETDPSRAEANGPRSARAHHDHRGPLANRDLAQALRRLTDQQPARHRDVSA